MLDGIFVYGCGRRGYPAAGARRGRPARGASLSLELSLWGDAPAIRKKSRISSLAYLRGFDFALLFILNTYK